MSMSKRANPTMIGRNYPNKRNPKMADRTTTLRYVVELFFSGTIGNKEITNFVIKTRCDFFFFFFVIPKKFTTPSFVAFV